MDNYVLDVMSESGEDKNESIRNEINEVDDTALTRYSNRVHYQITGSMHEDDIQYFRLTNNELLDPSDDHNIEYYSIYVFYGDYILGYIRNFVFFILIMFYMEFDIISLYMISFLLLIITFDMIIEKDTNTNMNMTKRMRFIKFVVLGFKGVITFKACYIYFVTDYMVETVMNYSVFLSYYFILYLLYFTETLEPTFFNGILSLIYIFLIYFKTYFTLQMNLSRYVLLIFALGLDYLSFVLTYFMPHNKTHLVLVKRVSTIFISILISTMFCSPVLFNSDTNLFIK